MRRHVMALAGAEWAVAHRPGRGRPVLLLHGFAGTGLDFEGVLHAFGERPLWSPDLPGHGATARLPSAPACDFAAVRAGLGALAALAARWVEPPDVVGYSMGGRLALDVCLSGAVRAHRLVLIGATAGLDSPSARATRRADDAALAARLESLGTPRFLREWSAGPLFARLEPRMGERAFARLQRRRAGVPAVALARALRGLGTGAMDDLWPALPAFGRPVLCLAGEEDLKFRALAERMAARLAAGRAEVVPGAGHAAHWERPDDVGCRLARFLAP